MPNVSKSTSRIPAAAIRAFMIDAFRACGLPEADAGIVANAMLDADLSGSDAHGIFRLAGYVRLLKRGQINPRANIKVLERGPATALVDGDNGMGHLVMTYAANLSVEIAREAGVAWIGVRRSNHSGAGSTYAAMPLAHGMVGIYSAVSSIELHGAVGRRRALARHQSDRGRDPGRQGAADRARHRDVSGVERCDPHLCQRGPAACRSAG